MSAPTYRITRLCCRTGHCLRCQAVATGRPRKRVIQATGLTEATARKFLLGWRDFEPKMEPETK
jgi:hypothetical protein